MIAELVKQYETLKRCGQLLPDPYFDKLPVSAEIHLRADGSFCKVDWLCTAKEGSSKRKVARKVKEVPTGNMDCPVTERSSSRSSGNDSPHGLVDNPSWLFGELAPAQKVKAATRPKKGAETEREESPGAQRAAAYLRQLNDLYQIDTVSLTDVRLIHDALSCDRVRSEIWKAIESLLKEKLQVEDGGKWQQIASKANIRWVVQTVGSQGKPVNALDHVKAAWIRLQEGKSSQGIISVLDGKPKPARTLHPRIRGATLVSFNDPATYCHQLHPSLALKTNAKGDEEDGSAVPAQIGFEEAEKYKFALDWLIDHSCVRFGDSANCIWVDQASESTNELDTSAHEIVASHARQSVFTRGKAKKGKGQTLADSAELIEALQRFRDGRTSDYRNRTFHLLSILLRNKGRHAILGGFVGVMGELEDNVDAFIKQSAIQIPRGYINAKDPEREFCPTLTDILDTASVKSQKRRRFIWDREVVEVIVRGSPLPPELCRRIVLKAIKEKHRESSQVYRGEYSKVLAVASACARHYLTRIRGKEKYGMGLDKNNTDAGYLAGRLFAVCEDIQKRGRSWGATLSDKLFSAGIDRPRDTLAQLYKNCLCYDIYKNDREWFSEIFDKISLSEKTEGDSALMPVQGVDPFEFLLGYWHQRGALRS